jgi:ribose-phosphate pyrophosphokinase
MSASSIMRKLDRSPNPSLLMQGSPDVIGSRSIRPNPARTTKQDEKDEEKEKEKKKLAKAPETAEEENLESPQRLNAPGFLRLQSSTNPVLHRTSNLQTPAPARSSPIPEEGEAEYTDERAKEVIHGRLVQGHIVSDDYPSPTTSAMSNSIILEEPDEDPMVMSRASSFFAPPAHPLGGSGQDDPASSDEEEDEKKDPGLEQMITLVGDVKDRIVFIIDDMIDKAGSWIAAAETVVKRGGAKKVYCIATHGLFGGDSLQMLQDCDCIDQIVVTNSFPISEENARAASKLVVIDLSWLLSESIRRNHFGESISALAEQLHY